MEPTNQFLSPRQLDDDQIDLLPYLRKLVARWRLIAISAALAMLLTAWFDIFEATRTYRAEAMLEPISSAAVEGRIAGDLGGLGGASSGLSGLASALGGGGGTDADQYIAIMQGFQFNTTLAARHPLPAELLATSWLDDIGHEDPKWRLFRRLQERLSSENNRDTGTVTVSFVAQSPAEAEQILGYYIDDLRDLLRAREITDAATAIDSLRAEAATTADPILRSALYNLEAKQVEHKKMAQVEADFAFRVLDPPAAPDKKYRPKVTLDCAVGASLAALAAALYILLLGDSSQRESRSPVFQEPVGITSRKIGAAGGSV